MATDDPDSPSNPKPSGCRDGVRAIFGFLAFAFLSFALAALAIWLQAPAWGVGLAFFTPIILVILIGVMFIPRMLKKMREMELSAPSPESFAASKAAINSPDGDDDDEGDKDLDTYTSRSEDSDSEDEPHYPTIRRVKTEAGKVLAHRLIRSGMPAGCQFGCAAGIAAFWNGIVGVFLYQIYSQWNRGAGINWFMAVFMIPFALIGLGLIAAVVYSAFKWFVSMLVGRVEVEVSAHPLVQRAKTQIRVSQFGIFPLGRVEVSLVCTEKATYVAGTSQSSATKQVAEHEIPRTEFDSLGGLPFEADFVVPADTMHSFSSPNNEIAWRISVTGRVLGILPFSDDYELSLIPG